MHLVRLDTRWLCSFSHRVKAATASRTHFLVVLQQDESQNKMQNMTTTTKNSFQLKNENIRVHNSVLVLWVQQKHAKETNNKKEKNKMKKKSSSLLLKAHISQRSTTRKNDSSNLSESLPPATTCTTVARHGPRVTSLLFQFLISIHYIIYQVDVEFISFEWLHEF